MGNTARSRHQGRIRALGKIRKLGIFRIRNLTYRGNANVDASTDATVAFARTFSSLLQVLQLLCGLSDFLNFVVF